ncbi:uncharacterized protein [Rutidosis leptorrhynchoides]|uniref:uncharacterized protein n=1 Tax=Rutidosis leptorrhynchoides TaxID=125765 RepID=UPI003A98D40B
MDWAVAHGRGPDGLNIKFLSNIGKNIGKLSRRISCWQYIQFSNSGDFFRECNALFIIIVPKKPNLVSLNDYQPISLIGSYYKIIANLLSNWLRKVISNLVSYGENGFGAKWKHWILSCLNSPSISILINGLPTNEFKLERGVHQGDPLSPFIFMAEGVEKKKLKVWRVYVVVILELPFTYLELQVGVKMNKLVNWKLVLDKFRKRLRYWKARAMSFSGRLLLVPRVLKLCDINFFPKKSH